MKLGKTQQSVLESLVHHEVWGPYSGWLWDTWSGTTRIMDSLVKRGMVELNDRTYTPTEEGKNHVKR